VCFWLLRHVAEYDVVCVIDYRGVGIPPILSRVITGRPVLVQGQVTGVLSGTVEQLTVKPEPMMVRALKWLPRMVYRRADAIACISSVLEDEAVKSGVPRERVHLLPNAVDMRRFRPPTLEERSARRRALNVGADEIVCLFVGRLSLEKGLMDLLEAWRLAQPADGVLVIAGPDMVNNAWDAGPSARAFVHRHQLGGSVKFIGASSDVPAILQAADVLVQPSHFEAQGLSAVEALACGVPVIATAVGGLKDFVVDGVNGRLVSPRDPAALSAAIRELVLNRQLRERLAASARPSVERYDERVIFSEMVELLTRLARRSGR
jgi:glycosyltransferase involved in cell wall biosynthesis